jgi:AcrR family transcriptional regulator
VRDIAARAGLNMQLISYYFGGKAGLYAELQRQWGQGSRDLASPGPAARPGRGRLLQGIRGQPPVGAAACLAGPVRRRPAADRPELMRWITAELACCQQAG